MRYEFETTDIDDAVLIELRLDFNEVVRKQLTTLLQTCVQRRLNQERRRIAALPDAEQLSAIGIISRTR